MQRVLSVSSVHSRNSCGGALVCVWVTLSIMMLIPEYWWNVFRIKIAERGQTIRAICLKRSPASLNHSSISLDICCSFAITRSILFLFLSNQRIPAASVMTVNSSYSKLTNRIQTQTIHWFHSAKMRAHIRFDCGKPSLVNSYHIRINILSTSTYHRVSIAECNNIGARPKTNCTNQYSLFSSTLTISFTRH